jgi:hypothetical protein
VELRTRCTILFRCRYTSALAMHCSIWRPLHGPRQLKQLPLLCAESIPQQDQRTLLYVIRTLARWVSSATAMEAPTHHA